MGKFNFIKTSIEGVTIVEPTVFGDQRGYFMETYNYNDFKQNNKEQFKDKERKAS